MRRTTMSWLIAAGAALTVLLAVNAYLTFQNTRQLNRDAEWVEHTQTVISSLENILSLAKDAETGTRGFVITGNPEYLQNYYSGIAGMDAAIADLEAETTDDAAMQARFPELRQRIKSRFAILEEAIASRKDSAFDSSVQGPAVGRGKLEMDALRAFVGDMTAHQRALLAERSRQSERTYWFAQVTGLLSGLLAIAALLAGLLILRRYLADKAEAEAVITEQAERLRTTLASIGDAVITTDTAMRITNINAAAETLTGWKNEEARGEPLESVFKTVDEKSHESVENPAFRAVRDGIVVNMSNHTVLVAKDGTELPIDNSAAPIRCSEGEIVGCVLVFRDVSDRRRQNRELEQSEARLRQLADAMPQIVWAAQPDGTLDYYNRRWFEYIDMSQNSAEEAAWDRFIHPDDLPRTYKKWAEAIESGDTYETEFRLRRADGRYRWFLTRALPVIDRSGQIIRWYGTCTDIHVEKKNADELRELAATLSEADRRKNEFLAMLAHELRNPLAPIRNTLQILRMTGQSDSRIRSASEMMDRQVGQLVRLVDDLLDVSRISRSKIELRLDHIDLGQVIDQAAEAARLSAANGGIKISIRKPAEPIYILGDSDRLSQVIGNLLNNACKFSEKGGRVNLTVGREDGEAVIRVKDEGIGIAEDQLRSIFDMFVQADTTLERAVSGLGIGLTLVKSLVGMHGGSVKAESGGLGSGSTFTVRLPVSAEEILEQTADDTGDGEPAAVSRRILVVDDNLDSAQSLTMLLQLSGHDVRTAYDGLEAVEAADEFRPDVVLLDIGLPRLNGYEAAREIRRHGWGKNVVLIALTGWGQEEDRKRSKEAGFDSHLVKPIDHQDLVKVLDELVPVKMGH